MSSQQETAASLSMSASAMIKRPTRRDWFDAICQVHGGYVAPVAGDSHTTTNFACSTRDILFTSNMLTGSCRVVALSALCFAVVRANPKFLDAPPANALYKNTSAPVDVRVKDLLSRMTIEEVRASTTTSTHSLPFQRTNVHCVWRFGRATAACCDANHSTKPPEPPSRR